MPLPASIPVRYTDEEAGYVTVRPIVRQTFRLDELLDMILSVTGADVGRIRQILQSGTVVYHFYRYWWTGFDASEEDLRLVLTRFPHDDASRPFAAERCVAAVFEGDLSHARPLLELKREAGSRRRAFRTRSFWDRLLEIAGRANPAYVRYSYADHADVYRIDPDSSVLVQLQEAALKFGRGELRSALKILPGVARISLLCTRDEARAMPRRAT